jgi:hypothetical protein
MKRGRKSFQPERREWLARAPAGGAAIALLIRDVLAAGERTGAMVEVRGAVQINGRPARAGAVVTPGDRIATASGGAAVCVLGRDAFLIRESGDLRTAGDSALAGSLRLATGKLLSVFGRGAHNIVTPTATIGIRGTGIYVEAEAERTYVCTCYGRVELQARNMPAARETVQTTHHDAPRYVYAHGAMPISMIAPAPVINHTDAELLMLEALVGRKPPFAGSGGQYGPEDISR